MAICTQQLEPDYVFTTGELDGLPVVAVINVALADFPGCRDFPWQAQLTIQANHADAHGLPTTDEVDLLNTTEERLSAALGPLGAHHVARQTYQGRRLVDYYVADADAARRRVDQLTREGQLPRDVTFEATRDDDWAIWMPTLRHMCQPAGDADGHGSQYDQAVLVQIPLHGGEFGSDEEQQAVLELADRLAELAAEADAEFDGYEFGNSRATLFAYGTDADRLVAAFEPTLRRAAIARGAVITKRYGSDDDAREESIAL